MHIHLVITGCSIDTYADGVSINKTINQLLVNATSFHFRSFWRKRFVKARGAFERPACPACFELCRKSKRHGIFTATVLSRTFSIIHLTTAPMPARHSANPMIKSGLVTFCFDLLSFWICRSPKEVLLGITCSVLRHFSACATANFFNLIKKLE